MPYEITAFQCNYCRKVSRTKAGILNHEASCKWNPARRSCHTCKHCNLNAEISSEMPPDEIAFFEALGATQTHYTYKTMLCKHFNKPVSEKPYFDDCDHYNVPESYEEDMDRPMPGTCMWWEEREKEEPQK